MAKKQKQEISKDLKLYIKDQEIRRTFEILRVKWHMEGKIHEPTLSAAFVYMVTHVGQMAKGRAADNGSVL